MVFTPVYYHRETKQLWLLTLRSWSDSLSFLFTKSADKEVIRSERPTLKCDVSWIQRVLVLCFFMFENQKNPKMKVCCNKTRRVTVLQTSFVDHILKVIQFILFFKSKYILFLHKWLHYWKKKKNFKRKTHSFWSVD